MPARFLVRVSAAAFAEYADRRCRQFAEVIVTKRAGVTGVIAVFAMVLQAASAQAQFNPLTIVGKVVSTAMDVRSKSEVANDTEIAAGANKRLLDDERAEWKGVSLLVFAQHVVLAGAVQSDEAKKLVAGVVKQDQRIRSLVNELVVIRKAGDDGSMIKNTAIDTKIDAVLTAAKGISSVNMRWKTVNGNVVLMGVAQSKDEANLVLLKVRELDGVKSVKSHLRVVVPKK
jgi:osmotically-inducible protein OsmY